MVDGASARADDGDNIEETCHSPAEVTAWQERLLDDGVMVEMAIDAVHRAKIVLRLDVGWPGADGTHARYDVSPPGLAASSTCGQPMMSPTPAAG